jgi:hypothetical protein
VPSGGGGFNRLGFVDQEVAEVVTFIETSWGNAGTPATGARVAALRKLAE